MRGQYQSIGWVSIAVSRGDERTVSEEKKKVTRTLSKGRESKNNIAKEGDPRKYQKKGRGCKEGI